MNERILVAYDGSDGGAGGAQASLVVGYHGHRASFGRIIGSAAQSIARRAPCPVRRTK